MRHEIASCLHCLTFVICGGEGVSEGKVAAQHYVSYSDQGRLICQSRATHKKIK